MPGIGPLSAIAIDSEIALLRRMRSLLDEVSVDARPLFTDLMKAAFGHCRLDARSLADDLGYNFSTVHRWIDGRTAPHPSLWPRVAEWIGDALTARIGEIRETTGVRA